jgi:hypothetical protein
MPLTFVVAKNRKKINLDCSGATTMKRLNGHISASYASKPATDDDVPADFKDAATMTTPGGLSRILR